MSVINTRDLKFEDENRHGAKIIQETKATKPKALALNGDPVVSALKEEPPQLETPSAKIIEGFQSKPEVKQWAENIASMDPMISDWLATAKSAIEGLSFQKQRFQALQSRLVARIDQEPDEIQEPVRKVKYGLGASVFKIEGRSFIPIGILIASAVALLLLGFEFVFEKSAALSSDWGFAQSEWGARGLVFSISFGSFVLLTFWSAAEKYKIHWTSLWIARTGLGMCIALVIAIGVGLGKSHVEEGQTFGLPMVIIPFSAGVLICSAVGAKVLVVCLGKMAFPMRMVTNKLIKALGIELKKIEIPFSKLKKEETNAQQLLMRADDVISEFVHRISATWENIQQYKQTQDASRQANRRKAIADIEAKLAGDDLNEIDPPK